MKAQHNSQNLFFRTPFGAQPCETTVTLRLGVGADFWPKCVRIQYTFDDDDCKYIGMYFHSQMLDVNYFEAKLTLPKTPGLLYYTFEIKCPDKTYYYGNNEKSYGGIGTVYTENPIPFQITVYDHEYKTPDWFKGSVMYQIFCDRFYCPEGTDLRHLRTDILPRNWNDVPYYKPEQFGGKYLANDMFGGNLMGITQKLDYLADLGVSVLYLNPIFEAYSNHKYDTGDYETIDKTFGTKEDFVHLCKKAEEKGIRIVLDGVFNHTGSDSKYFNKDAHYPTTGAFQSKDSPYADWYDFSSFPHEYTCWWGIKTLPHVNELSPSYVRYILTDKNAIIKKWLRLGASGWRLDVVDELPDAFVQMLRTEVKKEKSDAVIIGEVWEDASNKISYGERRKYLNGDELDSAMNYPLRDALIAFVCEKQTGDEFNARINSLKENYPKESFMAMMNFLSSHDTPRILTVLSEPDFNMSKDAQAIHTLSPDVLQNAMQRFKLIYALQMLLPGTPCIFYGDETGMQGFGDPFCRKCFPWENTNANLHDYFKNLISLRNDNPALKYGDIQTVYGEGTACAFLRISGNKRFLIVCNAALAHDWYASLELGKYGITNLHGINCDESHTSDIGRFHIHIPPCSYKILEV